MLDLTQAWMPGLLMAAQQEQAAAVQQEQAAAAQQEQAAAAQQEQAAAAQQEGRRHRRRVSCPAGGAPFPGEEP